MDRSTLDFTLTPDHMATRFNMETPVFEGRDQYGDLKNLRSFTVKVPFELSNGSNPVVDVEIHVDVPDFVKQELQRIAEAMVIRYMIAEALVPSDPTSLD